MMNHAEIRVTLSH